MGDRARALHKKFYDCEGSFKRLMDGLKVSKRSAEQSLPDMQEAASQGKQAFCTSGEALGRGERAGSTPGSVTSGERERGVECAKGNAPFGGKGAATWKKGSAIVELVVGSSSRGRFSSNLPARFSGRTHTTRRVDFP